MMHNFMIYQRVVEFALDKIFSGNDNLCAIAAGREASGLL
jgi:hypothetical protein